MKSPTALKGRLALTSLFLFSLNMLAIAQDKIEIDKQEVGNWFQRNWIWVTTAVFVLLIIIVLSSGNKEQSKTTTVVKDDLGNVKRITTTEERS
jgi:NADH:ubiquinone oxidoreductase subunit 6 (subunit J)